MSARGTITQTTRRLNSRHFGVLAREHQSASLSAISTEHWATCDHGHYGETLAHEFAARISATPQANRYLFVA
jgi:hypothetical protein